MGYVDYDNAAYELIIGIVTLIAALHNVCIWVFHATYTYCTPETNKIHSISVWAVALTTIASICFMTVPYVTVYNDTNWNFPLNQTSCSWIVLSARLSHLICKSFSLHGLYAERLFHIFKGNVYAFKMWQMWSIRGFLFACYFIAGALTAIGSLNENAVGFYPIFDDELNICVIPSAASLLRLLMVALGVHTVVAYLITALYCRRLLIFLNRLNLDNLNAVVNPTAPNMPHQAADKMYYKIMVKSSVLAFVASFSGQLMLVLSWWTNRPALWFAVDSSINCWCLILIFDLYDDLFNLYPFCCGLCEKLMCYHCIVCCSCHCCCTVLDAQKSDLSLTVVHREAPNPIAATITSSVHPSVSSSAPSVAPPSASDTAYDHGHDDGDGQEPEHGTVTSDSSHGMQSSGVHLEVEHEIHG